MDKATSKCSRKSEHGLTQRDDDDETDRIVGILYGTTALREILRMRSNNSDSLVPFSAQQRRFLLRWVLREYGTV